MAMPMLPGYSFPDPTKQDFKKTQAFGFKNGHVINKASKDEIYGDLPPSALETEFNGEVPKATLLGPGAPYNKRDEVKVNQYVPPSVKYYKKVLTLMITMCILVIL